MAFVVRKGDQFEVRESRATPDGPRATTLATFRVLDDTVLRKARARAERPFDPVAVRTRARSLGAPTAPPDIVLAARRLLVELDRGASVPTALYDRLAARLVPRAPVAGPSGLGDGLEDALAWVGATDDDRGRALRDLLSLTDHLPVRRPAPLRFPVIDSGG